MTPSQRYNRYTGQSGYRDDPAQRHALYFLDALCHELVEESPSVSRRLPGWLRSFCGPAAVAPRGIYLWGGVGRGKTFLMDLFHACLETLPSRRQHFHQFMQSIHRRHDDLKSQPGDPVQRLADEIRAELRVLCLDEFEIKDIGDAMLIGRLLQALFERGLVLVTTSNSPPEALYADGLQRDRFLPAIDALTEHCRVVSMDGGTDYRSLTLRETGLFHHPHDEKAVQRIRDHLQPHLVDPQLGQPLRIQQREIPTRLQDAETLWFDFGALCQGPRSRFDYLEIAARCKTLVLTGVPCLDDEQADAARRFVSLIDVLYDHRVKLILSAHCPLEQLYSGDFLAFEFRRTRSRLLEMQGEDYLAARHQG